MILLVILLTIVIALLNSKTFTFLFAPKKPTQQKSCPTGFKAQGNSCVPNASFVQNGLKYVSQNPTKKIPDAYKPLVDQGYLAKKNNTWTSNPTPTGKPPVNTGGGGSSSTTRCAANQFLQNGKCVAKPSGNTGGGTSGNSTRCGANQVLQNGKCVTKPQGGGGGGGMSSGGGKPILPSAPQQQKPTSCTFGGKTVKNCLLQYYNGDDNFRVTDNGKRLEAKINPSSYDGSKDDKTKNRNRNEIALRDVVQKDGQTISFDFRASGNQNIDKNKSAIFFQLKPEGYGGNDAQIRLAVKDDGTIAYGLYGGDTISTGVKADKNNNIQIRTDNGRGFLYINGQPVKTNKGDPMSFSLGSASSTQIKFGLEAVPDQITGDIYGTYDNISF
jgi:hypothetical protein